MQQNAIKLIDFWVGNSLCLSLTVWRKFRDRFRQKNLGGIVAKPMHKVMFIKMIEQGATVLAFSAIKKAVERYGRENVFFCVFKENRPIVDFLGLIPSENVIEIRHDNLAIFAWDTLKMLFRCRKEGISATIDMEFFARAPAILAYLSGAKARVGLHRFTSEIPYRGDLLTHRVQYNPYLHTAKGYLSLIEALEQNPNELPMLKTEVDALQVDVPSFQPSVEEVTVVRRKLDEAFGRPVAKRIVILNPNASDMLPLRKWPTERFEALAKLLLDSMPDIDIVLTGAPSEASVVGEAEQRIASSRVKSMAGKTTLREVIVLYTLSELLITNDSGPGHFSSMTDIKSIVMFGPETPHLFGSLGKNSHFVWKHLACSPCVNVFNHRFSPCSDNRCMQSITTTEVYNLAIKLMDKDKKTESSAFRRPGASRLDHNDLARNPKSDRGSATNIELTP